jgi:hypothetical protein
MAVREWRSVYPMPTNLQALARKGEWRALTHNRSVNGDFGCYRWHRALVLVVDDEFRRPPEQLLPPGG